MVRKVISCKKKTKKVNFIDWHLKPKIESKKLFDILSFSAYQKCYMVFKFNILGHINYPNAEYFMFAYFFVSIIWYLLTKNQYWKKKNEIQILPQCNTLNENLCYFLVVEWFFTRFLWYTLHRHKQQFLQLIFLLHTYPFRFEHSLLLLIHVAATSNTQQTKNWKEKKRTLSHSTFIVSFTKCAEPVGKT